MKGTTLSTEKCFGYTINRNGGKVHKNEGELLAHLQDLITTLAGVIAYMFYTSQRRD